VIVFKCDFEEHIEINFPVWVCGLLGEELAIARVDVLLGTEVIFDFFKETMD
jgi:hypothetical protein